MYVDNKSKSYILEYVTYVLNIAYRFQNMESNDTIYTMAMDIYT